MAAANLEVILYPLVHIIVTLFQRLNLCFRGPEVQTVIPAILSDLTESDKSKMAAANPELLNSSLDM